MFLLPTSYYEVKHTPNKGKGVFARKDIPAGIVIGDYLGVIINADEEDTYEEKYGFYAMYYTDDLSVFPNLKKNGIHLFNHSCEPNCFMYTYKGHTLYFSLRKIHKGEELTVAYMLAPQDEECNPCTDICKCGSIICSGTIHLPEKLYDKWVAFDEKISKKTDKYMEKVETGQQLLPLASYPKYIPYNSVYALFGGKKEINPAQVLSQRLFLPQTA